MHIDTIELEIFKNLFVSVAEKMGVTLCRTGFSPNIKERLTIHARCTIAMVKPSRKGTICRCISVRCRFGGGCDRPC